jgi:hypothetical protein
MLIIKIVKQPSKIKNDLLELLEILLVLNDYFSQEVLKKKKDYQKRLNSNIEILKQQNEKICQNSY